MSLAGPRPHAAFIVTLSAHTSNSFSSSTIQLMQSLSTAVYSYIWSKLEVHFSNQCSIPLAVSLRSFLSTPLWKCQHQYYDVFCVHPTEYNFWEFCRPLPLFSVTAGFLILGKTAGPAVWSTTAANLFLSLILSPDAQPDDSHNT